MDVIVKNENFPVYCDTGPYDGKHRIDYQAAIYLTAEELQTYNRARGFSLAINTEAPAMESDVG